ncbi:SAYSvFN domain-containing protein 1-like [Saccostrea echinata]|uniref:SAYSvFN domain-containing protein 1-like n=1 Tax=Saccostrea echinata TaxID=191078 RepID=UPI002A8256CC|nr:SAYSvFN domain-containing protein 1-like [Saccostrea echinata]
MEKKLAEYRAKKAKENISVGNSFFYLFRRRQCDSPQIKTDENVTSRDEETELEKSTKKPWNRTQLTLTILMWILAWLFCIEHQFGAVFLVISLIFFIYYNTRTDKRKQNKLSAYSVFNPNCERIDGTFTSEQFEKELLHGASAVRN